VTDIDPRVQGTSAVAATPAPSGVRASVSAYVALTKPRIIELLLVTTVPVMFLAADGVPPLWRLVATLVGGALAAGGANTLNSYLDRDIDSVMARTSSRPLVTGAVTPGRALVFGIAMSVISVAWLLLTVNALSAALGAGAIAFYVGIYTLLLKRRTPQNIVWGGAAGCFPVLIGWTAITNSLAWTPAVLFLIVFLWTPPHYWPLSLRYRDDYAAARVPMLPVVADQSRVAKEIIIYSWAMLAATLVLIPVGHMGWFYGVAAVVLGAGFIFEAYALRSRVRSGAGVRPMRLFHYSITYLALLFLFIGLAPFLP
jgi:protoheme IX farnesyltransferase